MGRVARLGFLRLGFTPRGRSGAIVGCRPLSRAGAGPAAPPAPPCSADKATILSLMSLSRHYQGQVNDTQEQQLTLIGAGPPSLTRSPNPPNFLINTLSTTMPGRNSCTDRMANSGKSIEPPWGAKITSHDPGLGNKPKRGLGSAKPPSGWVHRAQLRSGMSQHRELSFHTFLHTAHECHFVPLKVLFISFLYQ